MKRVSGSVILEGWISMAMVCLLLLMGMEVSAQSFVVSGKVYDVADSKPLEGVVVTIDKTELRTETDSLGSFRFEAVPAGHHHIAYKQAFYDKKSIDISVTDDVVLEGVSLKANVKQLDVIVIEGQQQTFGVRRLGAVEGVAIYEGKKNEVVMIKDMVASFATNCSRQLYAKVPGINVWESDAAGLQLGVATRGLDPNRTSNFNTRQNGYDMSADALGYPESYYVPPTEAVERIEVIRGAASLQYGPQFGGLLNYVLQQAPKDHKIEWTSYTTGGRFKLVSAFNSLGGTVKGFSYYGFYNYKQGESWRPNSDFKVHNAFASLGYRFNDKLNIGAEYTLSKYVAQQSGGLTDAQFEQNARQSMRSRNWFATNWNIMSVSLNYKHNAYHQLNVRAWGFVGSRDAVGNLSTPNRVDADSSNRDLIKDRYRNLGVEARYMWKYNIKKYLSSLLVGGRFYTGNTVKQQGFGTTGADADFSFQHPDSIEGSDYTFPGMNVALFTENIFNIANRIKITPGIRYEYIQTKANGYYRQTFSGFSDSLVQTETRSFKRSFVLLGLGISYKVWRATELYANMSQNYRGITFTDMRVVRTSQLVDPNLRDEKGFNVDLGYRGDYNGWLNWDVSGFWLQYNNRIGQLQQVDSLYNIYRLTTNIGKSRSAGAEVYIEADFFKAAKIDGKCGSLALFVSGGYTNAIYTKSEYKNVVGKTLEFAPQYTIRSGIHYRYKQFMTTIQGQLVGSQFTDATNATYSANAVNGAIPQYYTLDWNARYTYRFVQLAAGINNLTNNIYYTRRAVSYPGPGIIPSEPMTFFVTLGFKINDKMKSEKGYSFH